MFMTQSYHLFNMTPSHHIINLMREMKVDQKIILENVYEMYENESKFYRGRPEMLVMKMETNGRNLQVFRGGKVQILGSLSEEEAESMRREFVQKLRRVKKMENCQVSPLTIANMVVSLTLSFPINLRNISHSNHDLSYEVELFPAALIRKWHPVHVATFHNGKVIVTGIKSMSMLHEITESIQTFFSEIKMCKRKSKDNK